MKSVCKNASVGVDKVNDVGRAGKSSSLNQNLSVVPGSDASLLHPYISSSDRYQFPGCYFVCSIFSNSMQLPIHLTTFCTFVSSSKCHL